MKILIVSCQKYSKTNRSIDTITEFCLEQGYYVDHLVFGTNKLKKQKKELNNYKANNFKQLYSKPSYFSYLGPMGKYFPDYLLKFIEKQTAKTTSFIEVSEYDLVILETGKPLFLLDRIPGNIPIVCRQSDPLEISLRGNRDYFVELEKKAFKRSKFTLVAHKKAVESYSEIDNLIEWKSGFEYKLLEKKIDKKSSKKNVTYMGMFKLDIELIKELASDNLDTNFHIIGNYEDVLKLSNVKFHGYLNYNEYIKILEVTDCFFVPYHLEEVNRMKKLGLTSKYYIPMSMGIPILTREYGAIVSDIIEFNIYSYVEMNIAKEKLKYILSNEHSVTKESLEFLETLKIENRKKSLDKLFKAYNLIK